MASSQVKIDVKDKKILTALAQDARRPLSQIARLVQLSRDVVAHRIKGYEKRGLLQGYKTVIDIKKFGFENFHIFIQLNKPPKEEEKKIIEKFIAFPFTRAVLQFSGKYDFEIATITPSTQEFENVLEQVLTACGKYLVDYKILLITKSYYNGAFPSGFFQELKKELPKRPSIEYTLDGNDYAILKILAKGGREEARKIAAKINLSSDSVIYRIKKMKNAGYIVGCIPAINYEIIGYHIYAVLMDIRAFTKEEEMRLKQFFKTDKNILWAVKTIGEYNIVCYICTKDPTDVHTTITSLREYFPENIRSCEILMTSRQYSYNYLPGILFK